MVKNKQKTKRETQNKDTKKVRKRNQWTYKNHKLKLNKQ